MDHAFVLVQAQEYVGQFLAAFREFPPSQKARKLFHRQRAGEPAERAKRDWSMKVAKVVALK